MKKQKLAQIKGTPMSSHKTRVIDDRSVKYIICRLLIGVEFERKMKGHPNILLKIKGRLLQTPGTPIC